MLNKVCLQGRLTKAPELKETKSGVPYMTFSVAYDEYLKDEKIAHFFLCKAWRYQAEFISKYFFKGQEIIIDGHLAVEDWGDKGKPTVLIVDKAHFCGSKSSNTQTQTEQPKSIGDNFIEIPEGIDDDLPFE